MIFSNKLHHMEMQRFSEHIGHLVSRNKIDQAINELRQVLNGSPQLKEVIIHSARYNELKEQIRMGTVSLEDGQITRNRIMLALLELVEEMTEQVKERPALSEEVQRVLNQVHNQPANINQQHYGQGDNVIGDKNVFGS